MARRISYLAVFVLLAAGCSGSGVEPPSSTSTTRALVESTSAPSTTIALDPGPWPIDGWPRTTPENVGIRSDLLVSVFENLAVAGGFDSVTVIRNGHAVVDTVFYPFGANDLHMTDGIAKGVLGTLVGMAIDRGLLAGVDAPVVELLPDSLPEFMDPLKTQITVEDLLTMSTGLDCRDGPDHDFVGLPAMIESEDWAAHVLALPMIHEPGTVFDYCNGASFLLSAILSEVTGKPASEFAEEVLFGPLGIDEFWWGANPGGITSFTDLDLRTTDLARLGYLYLRGGQWEGEQLVSAGWIEAATTPQIDEEGTASSYGYHWWVDRAAGYYRLEGSGGQILLAIPAFDMVVATTGGHSDERAPLAFVSDRLLDAVVADEPIDPDDASVAALAAVVERASQPPPPEPFVLPALASSIDGLRYEAGDNSLGIVGFEMTFADETARLLVDFADGRLDLLVGLDGRFPTDQDAVGRGSWIDEGTFVVDFHVIGSIPRGQFQFDFRDDGVGVRARWLDSIERLEAVPAG